MPVTTATIEAGARALINDKYSDHFSRDFLNDQADGTNKRFKLVNQNVVDATVDGAPADPAIYVNGAAVTVTWNKAQGVATFSSAPAAGAEVVAEYYFTLLSSATYAIYAQDAANFVGYTDPTQIPDLAQGAARSYAAHLAADQLANMTSWYYSANAGNKGFNKDAIANKFRDMAEKLKVTAEARRKDIYTRHDQREAPAYAVSNFSPLPTGQPKR